MLLQNLLDDLYNIDPDLTLLCITNIVLLIRPFCEQTRNDFSMAWGYAYLTLVMANFVYFSLFSRRN